MSGEGRPPVAGALRMLIEPRVVLVASEAGGLSFATGGAVSSGASASGRTATTSGHGVGNAGSSAPGELLRMDLARGLAQLVAQVRRSGETASHLKSVGARQAALVIEDQGRDALWLVPDIEIALEHRQKRSVISGRARVMPGVAGVEPFGVTFRLEDSEKARSLRLESQISQLVPRALARNLPGIGVLQSLDLPVSATGVFDLTTAGDVVGAKIDIDLSEGRLLVPTLAGLPLGLDKGRLALVYQGDTRRLELAPSVVELDGSRLKLAGSFSPLAVASGQPGWQLDLKAIEGHLVNDRAAPPLAIERLELICRHWPSSGATELVAFSFKAGGAELDASGALPGTEVKGGATLEGRIGAMSAQTFKDVWPSALAPQVRAIVARSLLKGQLKGGAFKIAAAGGVPSGGNARGGATAGRFSLALEGQDLAIAPVTGVPPLMVPRALLRVEGKALELTIPDAHMVAADGRRISFKTGVVTVADMDEPQPLAEFTGRAQGPLAAVLDIAGREAFGLIKPGQLPAGIDGKVDVQWRAGVPLAEHIATADIRFDGKLRISDGRIPDVLGPHDVTAANFNIGVTDKAIDIRGDLLLAGVPAKAAGQWIFGEDKARQPPLGITVKLDGADRRQLGLDLEQFVQGEVPVEILVSPGQGDRGKVQVSADLTGAELTLDALMWRKPSGRTARLAFDVVRPRGSTKGMELQQFKLTGDSITIDGTVTIGPDNKAQSYNFPGFSLNVVSNLEVQGVRRGEDSWEVKAHGKTLDGSELMRSLYAVGQAGDRKRPKRTGGLDLVATIDTVLGLNDGTLKQVRMHMRRLEDDIKALSLKGVLDGGSPLEVTLVPAPGQPRLVHARTADAGQALKLIGLYSNMVGGQGDLRVNLDGRGPAERAGELQVKNFRVLGDPIVSELLQGADDSRPAIAQGSQRRERRVVREQIEFETLKASFSSGNGQVALESLAAAGPLVGGSMRGKIDFRTRRLSLGGTYVPLSGLNRALAGLPGLGELLTGPRGDGVFGITLQSTDRWISRRCWSIRSRWWRRGCCARSSRCHPKLRA